jgi:hypothetical protein
MEYHVVRSKLGDLEDLVAKVNALIKQGWKPQGGICNSDNWYFQAMVK